MRTETSAFFMLSQRVLIRIRLVLLDRLPLTPVIVSIGELTVKALINVSNKTTQPRAQALVKNENMASSRESPTSNEKTAALPHSKRTTFGVARFL